MKIIKTAMVGIEIVTIPYDGAFLNRQAQFCFCVIRFGTDGCFNDLLDFIDRRSEREPVAQRLELNVVIEQKEGVENQRGGFRIQFAVRNGLNTAALIHKFPYD